MPPQDTDSSALLYASPFEVLQPDVVTAPLVFSSPHSGRHYPLDFISSSRLDAHNLRRSEDGFVDDIFVDVPLFGAPLLKAHFPRAYVDVNREPYELDPSMFSDALPGFVNTRSPRVAGGLGTIARVVSENEPIYKGLLTFEEAEARIGGLYYPYHSRLEELIKDNIATFGASLLVDCHSMPSRQLFVHPREALSRFGHKTRPDFVLGDKFGQSCPHHVTEFLEQELRKLGYSVARNKPYAGGYITQKYGVPTRHSNCIQLEINRGLYMDEEALKPHSGLTGLKEGLMVVFEKLAVLTQDLLAAPRWAAE